MCSIVSRDFTQRKFIKGYQSFIKPQQLRRVHETRSTGILQKHYSHEGKKNRAWITVSLNKKQTFQLNETILTCIGAIDLFEITRLPPNLSNYLQVRFIFLQVQQLPSHAPRNQFLNRWKMENFQTFYYMNNHSSGYFNDEQNNNDRQSKSIWQFILI